MDAWYYITVCGLSAFTVDTLPKSQFQYDKDLCRIKLCGLQDLRPAVLSQRLVIYGLSSTVWSLQSVVCRLQSANVRHRVPCGMTVES